MSGVVNVISNVVRFDEKLNAHIDQLGQFHDLDGSQDGSAHMLEKSYEQGLEDGYLKAEQTSQDHIALSTSIMQSIADIKTEIEAGHRRVITTLLQAALPALAKKNMTGEIIDFMTTLSAPSLSGQVTFWVNPSFETTLESITQSISNTSNTPLEFIIETDETLSGHAIRATWQGGSGTIDIESTIEKILSRIEQ